MLTVELNYKVGYIFLCEFFVTNYTFRIARVNLIHCHYETIKSSCMC